MPCSERLSSTFLRVSAPGLVAVTLALGSAGCVEEQAFYIAQNQLPVALSEGGCGASTDQGSFRSRGLLDVSVGQGYVMFPLIRFEIESSGSSVEKNNFVLRRFNVDVDPGDVPANFDSRLTSFAWETTGQLSPGSTLATTVKVIPDQLSKQLEDAMGRLPAGQPNPTVMVTVEAVATRLGTSSEIVSAKFRYPIEICSGCLVELLETCPGDAKGLRTNICGLPQDAPVVCCGDGPTCLGSGSF